MTSNRKTKIDRRTFLALTGGTGAGLMFHAQKKFIHKLIPYVNAPQYPAPGEWAHILSSCRECPAGCGLMMWYREGRVTKAEGNPENPLNEGKICIRGQSSVLGQYDTGRYKNPLIKNKDGILTDSSWETVLQKVKQEIEASSKVRVVSNLQTGSLAGVMEQFASGYNRSPLYYEVFNYESVRIANAEQYGLPLIPRVSFEDCDYIISFGADFLETWLSPVEYALQFSRFHSLKNNKINKFIYFGAVQNLTAVNSDEFIVTEPGTEALIIRELIRLLGGAEEKGMETGMNLSPGMDEKLLRIADELRHARKPVIVAGSGADKSRRGIEMIKESNRLNELLGNPAPDFYSSHALSRSALTSEVQEFFQSVDEDTVLVIHDTNPAYTNPQLSQYFQKAKAVVYIGPMPNETSALAGYILPSNYYLEDWGDYEAWSGIVSLLQPVMRPLFNTKSAGDIFLALNNQTVSYSEIVRENWIRWSQQEAASGTDPVNPEMKEEGFSDEFFRNVLQKGYLQKQKEQPQVQASSLIAEENERENRRSENQFYLLVSPSLFFYDGSLSNRGWLQEIPHPVSNIVWQSWLDMNRGKALELEIEEGDVVTVISGDKAIQVAVRLTDEVDRNTLAIDAGQGHFQMGETANGVGVNIFLLPAASSAGVVPKVTLEKTEKRQPLLFLNATKEQHDRELLQHVELEKIKNDTAEAEEMNWPMPDGYEKADDLYEGHTHKDHRWGMVIDLQRCIGCKACEAACYAENNIPVVGRENCCEGREMSWLKIVPYYLSEKKKTAYLPVPCQHCDSAPCEPVCPVYAAVHTEEGLNAQIYNRCIGTRYCSNNCPYKVRRFNWVNIGHQFPMTLQLNPEVTVRERGVMEKCTFCVQRIRNNEYRAKIENRPVKDGEIIPACAQTCPTNAIVFGDLMDEKSEVRQLIKDPRRYQLLNELNTKTAVVYLKKVTV